MLVPLYVDSGIFLPRMTRNFSFSGLLLTLPCPFGAKGYQEMSQESPEVHEGSRCPAWCTCSALLKPLTGQCSQSFQEMGPQLLPSLSPAYAGMFMSSCWGLEVCKAPAHRWCREVQCCELWSCCCWPGSSGCASTVWLVRLGVGGLMMGQDRASSSSFTSSHSRKSKVGLGQLESPTCACGVDADGTVLSEAPAGEMLSVLVSGEAACCSSSLKAVPCLPSSSCCFSSIASPALWHLLPLPPCPKRGC